MYRGAYYVPYSFLLISNKFCIGGGGGGGRRSGLSTAIKFLYAPAPPSPTVWALKPPSWALVHKTTYAPMIYTALCIKFWTRAYPLRGEVGGDWALEIEGFFGSSEMASSRGCINHRYINANTELFKKIRLANV
jgi:hypothetical protein